MSTTALSIDTIPLSATGRRRVKALIATSHRKGMDLNTVLPWENGVNMEMQPKPACQSWIYGTPYWDQLTPPQQHEVLWLETARDVSMFIWLEQVLPPLYVGYTNRFRDSLSAEIYEYLMIFSKEEIVHTLMFRRYMEMTQLPLFAPAGEGYGAWIEKLQSMPPIIGIMWTVMIEWGAELNVIHATQGSGIEPLTSKMFFEHHVEEVRHIAFSRQSIDHFFNTAPASELEHVREFARSCFEHFLLAFTYNPEIASHTSFVFPIQASDTEVISQIRDSAHNRQLNEDRFGELFKWLKGLEVL